MTNEGNDAGSCDMFELHDVTLLDNTLCCVTLCHVILYHFVLRATKFSVNTLPCTLLI